MQGIPADLIKYNINNHLYKERQQIFILFFKCEIFNLLMANFVF